MFRPNKFCYTHYISVHDEKPSTSSGKINFYPKWASGNNVVYQSIEIGGLGV